MGESERVDGWVGRGKRGDLECKLLRFSLEVLN